MSRKIFKKTLFVIVFVMTVVSVFALKTDWGDSLLNGTRESETTGIFSPARFVFDNNVETCWNLEKGKTHGWFEKYWDRQKDINSIEIEAYITEGTTLTFSYEKDGIWIPYEYGEIQGPINGITTILLSNEVRRTSRILTQIDGETADECKIYEIAFEERSNSNQWGKILPEKYTFNLDEYISIKPDRLWNGYVDDAWFDPLWYIPWEIQQTPEGRNDAGIFAPYNGLPNKNGEIIWELDDEYRIDIIKVYVTQAWRNIAFEFWDGNKWTNRKEIKDSYQTGWFRIDANNIRTSKIKITFPAGWESARFISEVEFWGEGEHKNSSYSIGAVKDENENLYRTTIAQTNKNFNTIEVITDGAKKLSIEINGNKYQIEKSYVAFDGRAVFKTKLNKDDLRIGTQFITINAGVNKVEDVILREEKETGKINLNNSFSDGFIGCSENDIEINEIKLNFDRQYELEKLRVYKNGNSSIWVYTDERTSSLKYLTERDDYWEIDLAGLRKNSIRIGLDNKEKVSEIEVYGSPIENTEPVLEMWNFNDINKGSCIVGWIGNPLTDVLIDNFYHPRRENYIFWLPTNECNNEYFNNCEHVTKVMLDGKTAELKYRNYAPKDTANYTEKEKASPINLTIDLPFGDIYTQKEIVLISGKISNCDDVKVYVNSEKIDVEGNNYSQEVLLSEGTNTITVEATDSTGRQVQKNIKVIRDSVAPEITILQPYENEYINKGCAVFLVDGNKDKDLWWKFNEEDWEPEYGTQKLKNYYLEDGYYTYTVWASDRAGNISEPKSVDFCMDVTPPASFPIFLNVRGWTSNTNPIATFETTDETAGIDHYEYRIDENKWVECSSPLQIEKLNDGKRLLQVRAIDKAGNIREENIEIDIDTSCPPMPENARPVPDEKSIFVKWVGLDDNSFSDNHLIVQEGNRSYKIERIPAWDDGVRFIENKGYGKLEYEDTDTIQGEAYSYRIWSVDRAGNESEKTEWKSAITGLAVADISENDSTIIEFQGLTVTLPKGATAEDIVKIQIQEIPQSELKDDSPINPLLGGIYSVTVVRKNGEEEYITEHADLLEKAALEIGYSPLLLPNNYAESEMAVFYYDDLWGSWVRMNDCYIDSKDKVVRCQTNHFTTFSVQATKRPVLTEAELREGSYSLKNTEIGYKGIDISGEDAGVSTQFVEFSLPGKNGLDFSVQRIYSTAKALEDSVESEEIDIDGEKIWKIADGWRINMPYMMWNGDSIVVHGTDGMTLSLSQMKVKDDLLESKKEIDSTGNEIDKSVYKLFLECHEYSDCILELDYKGEDVNLLKKNSYKFNNAILHQSDGKKVYYGSDGKVEKITDCTGKNVISFSYPSLENKDETAERIIIVNDSYDREIKFSLIKYTVEKELKTESKGNADEKDKSEEKYEYLINTIQIGDKKVTYTVTPNKEKTLAEIEEGETTSESKNNNNEKYTLRLVSAKDIGQREWKYTYRTEILKSNNFQMDSNEKPIGEENKQYNYYTLLTSLTGPEIGYTEVNYSITKDLNYIDEMESNGSIYKYKVSKDKISAYSKVIWEDEKLHTDDNIIRVTNVYVVLEISNPQNIYVIHSKVDDGLTTVVTDYGKVEKKRQRLSISQEATTKNGKNIYKITNTDSNPQTLTYAKEVKTYNGMIADNNIIQITKTTGINEKFMRITESNTVKGNSAKVDTYSFDEKGNTTSEKHEYTTGEIVTGVEIYRTFEVKNNLTNLVTKQFTRSYGNKLNNYEYCINSYNDYGQIVTLKKDYNTETTDKIYTEKYFENKEENFSKYQYSYNDEGILCEILSPEKNVTSYTYDYSILDEYKITTSYEQIKEGLYLDKNKSIENGVNVIEENIYYLNTGNLKSMSDRDGYITTMEYDNLNRMTKQTKYHLSGTNTGDCSEIKVTYDDNKSTSTVTDELGCITTNYFDNLGRLIKVEKKGKSLKDDYSANEAKTITVLLEYDGYDRVIKMTEPSYETPSLEDRKFKGFYYAYDSLNRITRKKDADGNVTQYLYDDNNSKVTENYLQTVINSNNEKNEEVSEFLVEKKDLYKDFNGNIIKEITYSKAYENGTLSEGEETPKEINIAYDGKGKKLQEKDAKGSITKYKYNSLGLLTEVEYPDGLKEISKYNKDGQLISSEKQKGNDSIKTTYSVNGLGYVYKIETPVLVNGESKLLCERKLYDKRGNVCSEETLYEEQITVDGKNSYTDDSDIRTILYEYDWGGRVLSKTEKRDDLIKKRTTDCVTKNTYDKKGNLTSVTDPRQEKEYTSDFRMFMEYDSFGRIIKSWLPKSSGDTIPSDKIYPERDADVYFVYDAQGNNTCRKDKNDTEYIITENKYSNAGNLLSSTVGIDKTEYEYNGAGKVTKKTNPDGTWIEYKYDSAGQIVSEYYSGCTKGIENQYDRNGNLTLNVDRNGNKTVYEYDCMNRLKKIIKDGITVKSIEYDLFGRTYKETDGEENSRTYNYDSLGRIITETINTNPETKLQYEYDGRGNVVKFVDGKGVIFKREYTKTDKLLSEKVIVVEDTKEVEKETWKYEYDEAGFLKSIDSGKNKISYNIGKNKDGKDAYEPDAYGNVLNEKNSSTGFTIKYEYDDLNRLKSVTTPDDKETTYTYNNNQVSSVSGFIENPISYEKSRISSYSMSSEKISKNYAYNNKGLISKYEYTITPNLEKQEETKTTGIEYEYDDNFNINKRKHLDTELEDTYEYDSFDRLKSSNLYGKFSKNTSKEMDPFFINEIYRDIDGKASESESTLNGAMFNSTSVVLDANAKSFVYDFTESKEIHKLELYKTKPTTKSRIRERDIHVYTKNKDELGWNEIDHKDWIYITDKKNESIHIILKNSVSAEFLKIRTIWDDRNIENEGVSKYSTFENNTIQDMIRIWTFSENRNEQYEYDSNSNRIKLLVDNAVTKDYEYYKNSEDGNTAMVKYDGEWYYLYDANGNRISKSKKLDDTGKKVDIALEYWSYTWDYHNRLINVQQFNPQDNDSPIHVAYEYDALNRRISRTSLTKETEAKEETKYAYGRNGALLYEKKTVNGKEKKRSFVYLNDQIIGFYDNGAIRYTVTDLVGTVTEVYDENCSLLWKSDYTAFGIVAGNSVNLFEEGFEIEGLFTSSDADPETGLSYHWNRWRSEDGCSWLTQDPAKQGNNWYGYCGQNPISRSDSTGLFYYTQEGQQATPIVDKSNPTGGTQQADNNSNDNSALPKNIPSDTPTNKDLSEKGKRTSSDILREYRKFQEELEIDTITKGQLEILYSLQIEYNLAILSEGNLSITDYVVNGIITTGFDEAQDVVGNYKVNAHYGIDVVGGDLKSPFFLQAIGGSESGSNDKIFSIVGTDLKIRIKHGDKGQVIHDTYSPGDKIMSFPKFNNANIASTGPHFHIDMTNGTNFINPLTFQTSTTQFKQTFNGGETWSTVIVNY